jgi:hypothetical protein
MKFNIIYIMRTNDVMANSNVRLWLNSDVRCYVVIHWCRYYRDSYQ